MLSSLLALVGCGKSNDAEFREVAGKAMDELRLKTSAHQAAWGLGQAKRWALDQEKGVLVFTFPDKIVNCEAQIVGSYNKPKGTWLWSWDNPSVISKMAGASEKARAYGKTHCFAMLTKPEWSGSEDEAWEMAALTVSLSGAQGVYRGPAGDVLVFIAFGTPQISKLSGTAVSNPVKPDSVQQ